MYDDYAAATDKSTSILHSLFNTDDNGNTLAFETNNFYKQAVAMFTRDERNKRQLTVNMGYNLERADVPKIHILMPNDSKGSFDSIGKEDQSEYDVETTTLVKSKVQTSRTVFTLMITSDNMSEVILIYYFLKAMFLVYNEHFELMGFKNLQLNGQDITLQDDLAPANIFHRSLPLDFEYESKISVSTVETLLTKVNFIQTFCNANQLD